MAEQVVYIPGVGVGQVAGEHLFSPVMLNDLDAVSKLTQEHLRELKQRLSTATGFLDPRRLLDLAREVVSDDQVAEAVQRTLRSLDPGDIEGLVATFAQHQKADKSFRLSKSAIDSLRQKLPLLVGTYPALQRFEKADRLASVTGPQLQSLDLVCDVRPLFDDAREVVEGLMPYTRLRIVASGPTGFPAVFEVELTAQQVNDLSDKATKAEKKLAALRESAKEWVPGGLPDLPLTRPPRKRLRNG